MYEVKLSTKKETFKFPFSLAYVLTEKKKMWVLNRSSFLFSYVNLEITEKLSTSS
jgi:hypothetical protein